MKRGKVAAKSIKSLLKSEVGGRWKTSNSNFPRLSPLCGEKKLRFWFLSMFFFLNFDKRFLWSSAGGGNDATSEADGSGNTETSGEDGGGERPTCFNYFF